MWDAALLTGPLAKGLVKQIVRSGDLQLTEPTTASEAQQIRQFITDINRSRCDSEALIYSLLFDKIYIDEMSVGGGFSVFDDLTEDQDGVESRPIVEDVSAAIAGKLQLTNSILNFHTPRAAPVVEGHLLSRGSYSSDQEMANLCAMLEPLVWARLKRAPIANGLPRGVFWEVLDLVVLHPELLYLTREIDPTRDELDQIADILGPFCRRHPELYAERVPGLINIINVKANVAASYAREAIRLGAVLPQSGIAFGRARRISGFLSGTVVERDELVVSVRVFLKEIEFWPHLESYTDVLRLREDPAFSAFREITIRWINALSSGDTIEESRLRREIRSANRAISRSRKCQRSGEVFAYVGLPLAILDLIAGSLTSTAVTAIGFGLQAYSDWLQSKNKWLLMGQSTRR